MPDPAFDNWADTVLKQYADVVATERENRKAFERSNPEGDERLTEDAVKAKNLSALWTSVFEQRPLRPLKDEALLVVQAAVVASVREWAAGKVCL